jgi:hypothetical protein
MEWVHCVFPVLQPIPRNYFRGIVSANAVTGYIRNNSLIGWEVFEGGPLWKRSATANERKTNAALLHDLLG